MEKFFTVIVKHFSMKNFPIAVLISTLAFFAGQFWLSERMRAFDPPWVGPSETRMRGSNPAVFEVMTFGQLPAAIDWLLIRSLVSDSSDKPVAKGTHPPAYYDLDLVTDLDPAFFQVYVLGANALAVIRSDGPGAAHLYEKANRFIKNFLPSYPEAFRRGPWRDDWRIPLLQAYVFLFELDDVVSAGRAFQEAAESPAVPRYAKALAKRFTEDDGAYQVGLRLLGFMIKTSSDEATQKKLGYRRKNLELQHFLYQVNREFKSSGRYPARDPRGGVLSLDPAIGRVVTTTRYEKVMGLP